MPEPPRAPPELVSHDSPASGPAGLPRSSSSAAAAALQARRDSAGVSAGCEELPVTSDWPLVAAAVRWVRSHSGCAIDLSGVTVGEHLGLSPATHTPAAPIVAPDGFDYTPHAARVGPRVLKALQLLWHGGLGPAARCITAAWERRLRAALAASEAAPIPPPPATAAPAEEWTGKQTPWAEAEAGGSGLDCERIAVRGAGDEEFDGVYVRQSSPRHGRPCWVRHEGMGFAICWDQGFAGADAGWGLHRRTYDRDSIHYRADADTPFPPRRQWRPTQGVAPAPRLRSGDTRDKGRSHSPAPDGVNTPRHSLLCSGSADADLSCQGRSYRFKRMLPPAVTVGTAEVPDIWRFREGDPVNVIDPPGAGQQPNADSRSQNGDHDRGSDVGSRAPSQRPAIIAGYGSKGTYVVRYDDGGTEQGLGDDRLVMLSALGEHAHRLKVGDTVVLTPEAAAEADAAPEAPGDGPPALRGGEQGVVLELDGSEVPVLVRGPRGGSSWYRECEVSRPPPPPVLLRDLLDGCPDVDPNGRVLEATELSSGRRTRLCLALCLSPQLGSELGCDEQFHVTFDPARAAAASSVLPTQPHCAAGAAAAAPTPAWVGSTAGERDRCAALCLRVGDEVLVTGGGAKGRRAAALPGRGLCGHRAKVVARKRRRGLVKLCFPEFPGELSGHGYTCWWEARFAAPCTPPWTSTQACRGNVVLRGSPEQMRTAKALIAGLHTVLVAGAPSPASELGAAMQQALSRIVPGCGGGCFVRPVHRADGAGSGWLVVVAGGQGAVLAASLSGDLHGVQVCTREDILRRGVTLIERTTKCVAVQGGSRIAVVGPMPGRARALRILCALSDVQELLIRVPVTDVALLEAHRRDLQRASHAHVHITRGSLVLLTGTPQAVSRARRAINALLQHNWQELQRGRMEKLLAKVAQAQAEVRVSIRLRRAAVVLSAGGRPTSGGGDAADAAPAGVPPREAVAEEMRRRRATLERSVRTQLREMGLQAAQSAARGRCHQCKSTRHIERRTDAQARMDCDHCGVRAVVHCRGCNGDWCARHAEVKYFRVAPPHHRSADEDEEAQATEMAMRALAAHDAEQTSFLSGADFIEMHSARLRAEGVPEGIAEQVSAGELRDLVSIGSGGAAIGEDEATAQVSAQQLTRFFGDGRRGQRRREALDKLLPRLPAADLRAYLPRTPAGAPPAVAVEARVRAHLQQLLDTFDRVQDARAEWGTNLTAALGRHGGPRGRLAALVRARVNADAAVAAAKEQLQVDMAEIDETLQMIPEKLPAAAAHASASAAAEDAVTVGGPAPLRFTVDSGQLCVTAPGEDPPGRPAAVGLIEWRPAELRVFTAADAGLSPLPLTAQLEGDDASEAVRRLASLARDSGVEVASWDSDGEGSPERYTSVRLLPRRQRDPAAPAAAIGALELWGPRGELLPIQAAAGGEGAENILSADESTSWSQAKPGDALVVHLPEPGHRVTSYRLQTWGGSADSDPVEWTLEGRVAGAAALPVCPSNGCSMHLSTWNGGAYQGLGWVCNECSHHGSAEEERWLCMQHYNDYCTSCRPSDPDGAWVTLHDHQDHSAVPTERWAWTQRHRVSGGVLWWSSDSRAAARRVLYECRGDMLRLFDDFVERERQAAAAVGDAIARLRRGLVAEARQGGWPMQEQLLRRCGCLLDARGGGVADICGPAAGVRRAIRILREADAASWPPEDAVVSATVALLRPEAERLMRNSRRLLRALQAAAGVDSAGHDAGRGLLRLRGVAASVRDASGYLSAAFGRDFPLEWAPDPSAAAQPAGAAEEAGCITCFSSLDSAGSGVELLCGHRLCNACGGAMLAARADGHSREPLRCPAMYDDARGSCPYVIALDDFRALAEGAAREGVRVHCGPLDYEDRRVKAAMHDTGLLVQCPTPDCSGAAVLDSHGGQFENLYCLECGSMFCPGGGQPHAAHFFSSCKQVRSLSEAQGGGGDGDAGTRRLLESIARPCPGRGCGVPVIRETGCPHMSCNACKCEWCWHCLRPYSAEGYESRGYGRDYYRCDCNPDGGGAPSADHPLLQERIRKTMSLHRGVMYYGFTKCDGCGKYPLDKDCDAWACLNCLNHYLCGDCHGAGRSCGVAGHVSAPLPREEAPAQGVRNAEPRTDPNPEGRSGKPPRRYHGVDWRRELRYRTDWLCPVGNKGPAESGRSHLASPATPLSREFSCGSTGPVLEWSDDDEHDDGGGCDDDDDADPARAAARSAEASVASEGSGDDGEPPRSPSHRSPASPGQPLTPRLSVSADSVCNHQ
eukprot:TRINITY_DN974_c0_g2_i1.p1 TRINITY_DN974_c0_g2~~TRINITY_DN974_c0_g2_i1.p1  ORF type:complete len:2269 (+),score=537.88 TRINITY_DN974_c0_g2_i1:101-6907(+)